MIKRVIRRFNINIQNKTAAKSSRALLYLT
nr:MAG TPA: hypothetical protein [Inoviridae sp.]